MKVYISGKITGDPGYWGKFAIAEETLECQGHIVLNPAILPEGMAPADYMRICMAMLDSADALVLLPDWVESDGASIEHDMARYTGKPIYILDEDGAQEPEKEKAATGSLIPMTASKLIHRDYTTGGKDWQDERSKVLHQRIRFEP